MRTVTQKEIADALGMNGQDVGVALCHVEIQYTKGAKHYEYEAAKKAIVEHVEKKCQKFKAQSDKWERILKKAKDF